MSDKLDKNCIFCKIIAGEIPSKKIFENDDMLVIEDINPQAKTHFLMLPKWHVADVTELDEQGWTKIAKCLAKVSSLTKEWHLENGFRIVTNKGFDGGQTVGHLHFHILGGEKLSDKMS
ncbi:MAG: histidine triad nucleotide-binding protein [Clostridia bacterium]